MMTVVRIQTISLQGMNVITVDVEVQIGNGLPRFIIVGLPDTIVSESRVRVMSALNFCLPPKNIVVNLLPSHIRKEGSHYDLPIALCLLVALNMIPETVLHNYIAIGGLALDGSITSVCGALPAAIHANALNKGLICPKDCIEAAILSGITGKILAPANIIELINYFKGTGDLLTDENFAIHELYQHKEQYTEEFFIEEDSEHKINLNKHGLSALGTTISNATNLVLTEHNHSLSKSQHVKKYSDWSEIQGQESAKRAALIALAGGHHLLLIGSPGSGKSMIAKSMSLLLPDLILDTALETTIIHNLRNNIHKLITKPPFREPHHGASMSALIGGGTRVLPGEISLANGGILFMDEFPEFNRQTLDGLREPMENGSVIISRANGSITYPAKFQLIAAMNPCRCGMSDDKTCAIGPRCRQMYMSRISGPLLDRFDLCARTKKLLPWELIKNKQSQNDLSQQWHMHESAKSVDNDQTTTSTHLIHDIDHLNTAYAKKLIQIVRDIQIQRQNYLNVHLNNEYLNNMLEQFDKDFLEGLCKKYELSGRGYYRMLRVARTIDDMTLALNILNSTSTDIETSATLSKSAILEAVSYRVSENNLK